MNRRTQDIVRTLGVPVWGATVTLALLGGLLLQPGRQSGSSHVVVFVAYFLFVLAFSTVGAVLMRRRAENPIGPLLAASSFAYATAAATSAFSRYGLVTHRGSLPGAVWAAWVSSWAWGVGVAIAGTFLLLVFPNGRFLSARWRIVAWGSAAGYLLLIAGVGLAPHNFLRHVPNPLGVEGRLSGILSSAGLAILLVSILSSITSVVLRYRRSRGDERQQMKWLALAGVVVLAGVITSTVIESVAGENPAAIDYSNAAVTAAVASVPLAIAVAILKHRLYDIDFVVNRTIVYGALAAFITGIYVAVVVGAGSLLGQGDEPNLALAIGATAVIALLFQPVRARIERVANRVVFGHRATPYEVLAQFAGEVQGVTGAPLLTRIARVLGAGTGASRAEVWLRVGDKLTRGAVFGEGSEGPDTVAVTGDDLPDIAGAEHVVAVTHQGELLGALAMTKRAGEQLTPVERALVTDLASRAGLVMRNERLTAELRARLDYIAGQAEELRASRRRIVAAQDAERRRLERNIHDGAQQHLVALAVRLRLAKAVVARDPTLGRDVAADLKVQATEALATLRELSAGIHPPALTERGVVSGLTEVIDIPHLDVTIVGDDIERFSPEAEAACYFCCLEALQNVAKYAHATRAVVTFGRDGGDVTFSVADDGQGFDADEVSFGSGLANMADRLAALGGKIEVTSKVGAGTTITGRVPDREPEAVGSGRPGRDEGARR